MSNSISVIIDGNDYQNSKGLILKYQKTNDTVSIDIQERLNIVIPHEDTNCKYSFLRDPLCTHTMLSAFHLQHSHRLLIRNLDSEEELQRFNKHVIEVIGYTQQQ